MRELASVMSGLLTVPTLYPGDIVGQGVKRRPTTDLRNSNIVCMVIVTGRQSCTDKDCITTIIHSNSYREDEVIRNISYCYYE